MALSDLLKDLDPKYASALSEITDSLRQEFDRKLSATRAELGLDAVPAAAAEEAMEEAPAAPVAVPAEMLDPIEELKHAVAAIDAAGSQGEILDSLVAGCARFASRCAVFLVREGNVAGWTSHGFSLSDDEMRAISFPAGPGSPWDGLIEGAGAVALDGDECGALCDPLGGESPEMGLLIPFVLNNQTAAGVYCDRVAGGEALNVAALQLVTFVASQVLENLPVRDRESTSTLRLAAGAAVGAGAAPAAVELPVSEPPAPAVEEEVELGPPDEEPAELEVEPPAAVPEAVAPPSEAASSDALFEAAAEPEPPAPSEMVEYPADLLPPEELAPEAGATGGLSAVPEPRQPEPAPPVESDTALGEEPPAPTLLSDASTQVEPPSDLEGPGWAFTSAAAAAPDTGDESQHEEARRLARLLVTEVKLYNEELVEEGRRKGNVYSVLREDIDRSRQIFEDRIAEDVRSHSDYFREALVRILAGGDPSILGA